MEHSQRTDANVVDVLLALGQVGTSAEAVCSYARVAAARGREGFRWKVEDFPLRKTHRDRGKKEKNKAPVSLSSKSFDQVYEDLALAEEENGTTGAPIPEAPKHIPGFLPTFPKDMTYKSTEVEEEKKVDGHQQWLTLQGQKQEAEQAVLSLEARVSEGEKRKRESTEAEAPGNGAPAGAASEDEGGPDAGFVPKQFAKMLAANSGWEGREGRGPRGKRRAAMEPPSREGKPAKGRTSALHGHPHKLSDLDAIQINQVVHRSMFPALGASVGLGSSQTEISKQARSKWLDFQKGGWGSRSPASGDFHNIDLAEREKVDRAETILKFGVKAAAEEELL